MQRQEWLFVTLKNLQGTASKNWKTSAIGKGKGSTSHSKHREGQKEITIFCSINYEFSIFLSCLETINK